MIKPVGRKLLGHLQRVARPAVLALVALPSPSGIFAKETKEPHGFDWAVSVETDLDLALNQAATNDGDIELFVLGQWYFPNRTKLYALYGNEVDYNETPDGSQFSPPSHVLYELYAEYDSASIALRMGKIEPSFGNSWTQAKGVAASYLSEDFELTECLGAALTRKTGRSSLSLSLFLAADNVFPADAVCKLGKNVSFDAVGSYPTGNLSNLSLQWNRTIPKGSLHLGARYLPGVDASEEDEAGGVAGLLRRFGDAWSFYAEIAAFDGYQGTSQRAQYGVLNTAYRQGNLTYSLTYAYRRLSQSGNTSLVSLGLDLDWHRGIKLQTGISMVATSGRPEGYLSFDLIIPLRLPKYG
ncbi:hypothetical protein [Imhoffiella purpurea]|uniref:Porin domain-containing protein n=1 Tax=Imhoffiella purpurea TaxID=1249627 RepID=W9V9Q9_9GAMM|nr:hypothetical protein [Imhoffiella purpurea]EXJ16189.1 hypothetical protein D779_0494 [Imhoffiella purpurea]